MENYDKTVQFLLFTKNVLQYLIGETPFPPRLLSSFVLVRLLFSHKNYKTFDSSPPPNLERHPLCDVF
jgi:hypothetical protein